MPRRKTDSSPYKVQVLDRVLSIIDALTEVREDASVAELAESVKLHKSTAHRLLSILERHRIVERDSQNGRYRLGLRLFELGIVHMVQRTRHHGAARRIAVPADGVGRRSLLHELRRPHHVRIHGRLCLRDLAKAELTTARFQATEMRLAGS